MALRNNKTPVIRECANVILSAMERGEEPNTKSFASSVVGHAYRLLKFEGLIRRAQGFILTQSGKSPNSRRNFRKLYKLGADD